MLPALNEVGPGAGVVAGAGVGPGAGVGVGAGVVAGAVVVPPAPESVPPLPPHPGRLVIAAPQASADPVSSSFRLVFETFDWSLESGVF